MKKISVIVPVYNVEQFLKRCLDSILAQSFSDIELVLVDDGSTDSSGKICDEYAAQHENIVVVHQENRGLAGARNTGMKKASGEYISFVDSDDYLDTDMYRKMYAIATEKNCDIISCKYYLETKNDSKIMGPDMPANRLIDKAELHRMLLTANENRILWFVWKSIYKKTVLDNNRISFRSDLRLGEDSPFLLQVLFCCDTLYYIDEPLYHYYQSPDSLTRTSHRPGLINHLEQIYIAKHDLYETYIPQENYMRDLDTYNMAHTLPLLIANEITEPAGVGAIMHNYRTIRNTEMIRSAFSNCSVGLIKSNLKFLAILLKFRLYLPLAILSKRR